MGPRMSKAATLPFAPDRQAWGFVERSELGVHGACDVTFRTPCEDDEDGPELPPRLLRALPLLLHDFHNVDLRDLPGSEKEAKAQASRQKLLQLKQAMDSVPRKRKVVLSGAERRCHVVCATHPLASTLH